MLYKRLFYVSASLLMLALAYHLGAASATAQATGTIVALASDGSGLGRYMAVTADGQVFVSNDGGLSLWQTRYGVFGSVPTVESSWGALKVKAR